jgi:hypothetical protein
MTHGTSKVAPHCMLRTGDLVRLPTLILAMSLTALHADAQDLNLPAKPNARATMRVLDLPRGFLAMFNTTVARFKDGRFLVTYGYTFCNRKRDAVVHVTNELEGLVCQGQTTRQPDKSGQGEFVCSKNGTPAYVSPIEIPAGTYGKFKGIDQGILFDMNRQQIGTLISQWNGWSFPDAAEITKM